MHNKIESINEIIRENVSLRLRELERDTFFSISSVKTSKDLSYSDITMTALEDEEGFLNRINSHSYDLRRYLAKHGNLRKTPLLRFHLDKTKENRMRIDKLLDEINNR